jgi:hypothetical protein
MRKETPFLRMQPLEDVSPLEDNIPTLKKVGSTFFVPFLDAERLRFRYFEIEWRICTFPFAEIESFCASESLYFIHSVSLWSERSSENAVFANHRLSAAARAADDRSDVSHLVNIRFRLRPLADSLHFLSDFGESGHLNSAILLLERDFIQKGNDLNA